MGPFACRPAAVSRRPAADVLVFGSPMLWQQRPAQQSRGFYLEQVQLMHGVENKVA